MFYDITCAKKLIRGSFKVEHTVESWYCPLTVYAPFETLWLPNLWIITWITSAESILGRTVNKIIVIRQLQQQTHRIRAHFLTDMYLATCISHTNCCSPPLLSCLYGLGSIPTIGTCAQRAPGPTAAQRYTSIVVLQSCISLFKPTCIGNISQSGVVIRFLLWVCHHLCFIRVTFCATLMWCKLIEFGMNPRL